MKPPRFLLREHCVQTLLRNAPRKKFLELGYGNGAMLVTLHELGFYGHGFEVSPGARHAATNLLRAHAIETIALIDELNTSESYDWIFMFELIGYLPDPVIELQKLGQRLSEGGAIVFSFVNARASYSRAHVGDMRCFTRAEVTDLVARAGFQIDTLWNYGFPLANLLEPLVNLSYKKLGTASAPSDKDLHETGLDQKRLSVRLASLVLNKYVIFPFFALQWLFRKSDLGNGYLVKISRGNARAER